MFIGRLAFPRARSMRAPTASGEIIPNSAGAARWSSVCEADGERSRARHDADTVLRTLAFLVDMDRQARRQRVGCGELQAQRIEDHPEQRNTFVREDAPALDEAVAAEEHRAHAAEAHPLIGFFGNARCVTGAGAGPKSRVPAGTRISSIDLIRPIVRSSRTRRSSSLSEYQIGSMRSRSVSAPDSPSSSRINMSRSSSRYRRRRGVMATPAA